MGIYSDRRTRGRGREDADQQDPYSVEALQRQIENTKKRISSVGQNPNPDDRNWFEKATNLPQNQNVFFDILDLIGRPGQAVTNLISDQIKGEMRSPGESLWRGFSGQSKVTGADILGDLGVENKAGKFTGGLALDVLTDPTNLIPGKVVAGGLTAGAKALGRGANVLADTIPVVEKVREGLSPLTTATKDTLGNMFKYQYGWENTLTGGKDDTLKNLYNKTQSDVRYQTEEAMRNVADTAKLAGGVDTGVDVGRIMEAPLKQFEDVATFRLPDGTVVEGYDNIKKMIKDNQELDKEIKDLLEQRTDVFRNLVDEMSAYDTTENLVRTLRSIGPVRNPGMKEFKESVPANLQRLFIGNKSGKGISFDEAADYLRRNHPEFGINDSNDLIQALSTGRRDLRAEALKNPAIRELDQAINNLQQAQPIATKGLINALRNPEIITRELQRPVRELSIDPRVQQAAQQLTESNNLLRQWAQDNGVSVDELEGYMTHILSAEERKLRKTNKPIPIDRGNFGVGQPNKKILNTRQLTGSVEDINEQVGRKFFEPNAYFSTAIGQKRLIEYVNAVKFRREVLSNPDLAVKYNKGDILPPGAVVIDTNNYKFLKDDTIDLPVEIGGQYIVTKGVKEALDRYQKLTTDEGTRGFLKAFDTATSWWKRAALFSIPYHLRNDVGAKFNNWVAGMNTADLVKYSTQADKEVFDAIIKGKESPLYNEYRKQGLGYTNLSQVEFAKYGEDPEKSIIKTITEQSRNLKGQVGTRLNPLRAFETSREFGDFIDQTNRFALYKWARNKGMSPEQAAEKVRDVHFDYSRLTAFEREFATRVIPFYRWMRNNIPFQIRQFLNDPRKYNNINKIRTNAQSTFGIDEKNLPDWMKKSFAIPVSGDDKGSGKFLGLNLPLGDLTKLSSPGKTLVDAISPLLKLPTELSLNRNFFYNKPIEQFEGQQKQFIGDVNIPARTAYALEQLTGQVGRGLSGYLQKPNQEDQDVKFRTPSLGISSLLKDYDAERARYFQLLNELKRLRDQLDYIEQQTGKRPPTVSELESRRR